MILLTNSWGGYREGSGRRKLPGSLKKKGYTFQLTEDEIKFIENLGGNNRSEGLRKLIEEYKTLKKQIDFSNCE